MPLFPNLDGTQLHYVVLGHALADQARIIDKMPGGLAAYLTDTGFSPADYERAQEQLLQGLARRT